MSHRLLYRGSSDFVLLLDHFMNIPTDGLYHARGIVRSRGSHASLPQEAKTESVWERVRD